MKKRLTVNTLAFGNLRKRKKQYILIIVGIVLAMVFSMSIIFFAACMSSSLEELSRNNYGNQDAILFDVEKVDLGEAVAKGLITEYGAAEIIAYGYSPGAKAENGMSIAKYDETAKRLSYMSAAQGRLPESAGEIAVESDALLRLGLEAQVGDEITLSVKTPDGDEYLPEETQKTYTLVGILRDKRSSYEYFRTEKYPYFPAAAVSDEEIIQAGGKADRVVYFNYPRSEDDGVIYLDDDERSNKNVYQQLRAFLQECGALDSESGEGVLFSSRAMAGYSEEAGGIRSTTVLAAILAGVLMLGSCMGIINAFNTNLLERTKLIGMLRALGATRRQTVNIFGREAIIICLISMPASILISYYLVKLITFFLGDDYVFIPSWVTLAACAAIGVCCVMAAALVPLVRAAKISPMQAIRNIELLRKMKNKRIRSRRVFDVPRLLSTRSRTFYRARLAGVSAVLVISVLISCIGFSLIKYAYDEQGQYRLPADYRVSAYSSVVNSPYANYSGGEKKLSENNKQSLLSLPNVSDVQGIKEYNVNILTQEDSEYLRLLSIDGRQIDYEHINKSNCKQKISEHVNDEYREIYSQTAYPAGLVSYEQQQIEALNKHVLEGRINPDKINSGEEIVLMAPKNIVHKVSFNEEGLCVGMGASVVTDGKIMYFVEDRDVICGEAELDYHAGDTVKLSMLMNDDYGEDFDYDNPLSGEYERYDREVKIGAIIYNRDLPVAYNQAVFLTTHAGLSCFGCDTQYSTLDVKLGLPCTDELERQMTAALDSLTAGTDFTYQSQYRYNRDNAQERASSLTALTAIIILFFSTGASLINNSLTARIRESKIEIGTLRAVGASAKELVKSYILQLLSIFSWGCGIGFGLSGAVWLIAAAVYKYKGQEMPLGFEIWEAALVCAVLFAICGINLWLKIKKQMKRSIVENIREL